MVRVLGFQVGCWEVSSSLEDLNQENPNILMGGCDVGRSVCE